MPGTMGFKATKWKRKLDNIAIVSALIGLNLLGSVLSLNSLPDLTSSEAINRAAAMLKDQKGSDGENSYKNDKCPVCRNLVKSFEKGLLDTARGKFEGGDSHWEETRLRSYKDSEVRLVEIQEKLCNDVATAKDQCQYMAEENESLIESWWFDERKTGVKLIDFLCMRELALCCQDNHFGNDCKPCPGYPNDICSARGTCQGNGTKRGTGKCKCHPGYGDEICSTCSIGYYRDSLSSEKLICKKCDNSCDGNCNGEGAKACEKCRVGFKLDSNLGCLDINECIELEHSPCDTNKFCTNTEGSFQCLNCDKSCNGCHGEGSSMCDECADDHVLDSGLCQDRRSRRRSRAIEMIRYTCIALTLVVGIIFRKNVFIASLVGIAVAIYIGYSGFTAFHEL